METNNTESRNKLSDFSAQITEAVENAAQSIVAIDARPRVATSGIVWREGGVIVSTNHTIHRDDNITVALEGGRTAAATLVGRDAGCDLAVLKIDDEAIAKSLKSAEITGGRNFRARLFIIGIGCAGRFARAGFDKDFISCRDEFFDRFRNKSDAIFVRR